MEKNPITEVPKQSSSHRVTHSIVSTDSGKSQHLRGYVKVMANGELLVFFEDEPVS